MLDMLGILDRAKILHAGAGHDFNEASKPTILTRNGIRIGCISFTDNQPDWEATRSWPGVFHVPVSLEDKRAPGLFDLVRQTRLQVDFLIVAGHRAPIGAIGHTLGLFLSLMLWLKRELTLFSVIHAMYSGALKSTGRGRFYIAAAILWMITGWMSESAMMSRVS